MWCLITLKMCWPIFRNYLDLWPLLEASNQGFLPFWPYTPITAIQARAVGKNADTWPVSDLVRLLLAVAKAKKAGLIFLWLRYCKLSAGVDMKKSMWVDGIVSFNEKCHPLKLTARTCNTGVGRWISPFSSFLLGGMLVFGSVLVDTLK